MASIGAVRPNNTASIRTPLFVLGVALALVAFLVMFAFGLLFANRAGSSTTVPIVVAKQDISARSPITLDQLEVKYWPSTGVPVGAFNRISQLNGQWAVVDIPKGQPLTANVITSNPDELRAKPPVVVIAPGYVALTLETNEQKFVAGYPAPGDYINILATADTAKFTKLNPRSVTVQVFAKVYILKTGVPTPVATAGVAAGVPSSVTVQMTQCDAAYMGWLALNTDLKYELVSRNNYPANPPKEEDPACPADARVTQVGPSAVDARWHFLAA
jgi:Flp pilus assembly protein CpaB